MQVAGTSGPMRLLTWNIQAGIGTSRYRDYFLRAHLQLVHAPSKTAILHSIAAEIAAYDLVPGITVG